MSRPAVTPAGARGAPAAAAPAPGQPGSPWWQVSWSVPAAYRALRATIVIPSMLALTFKVLHNEQMTIFAVFGSFGALVFTAFGGTRRDKFIAHLGLAVAGSVTLILGTLASGTVWVAVLVTIPVTFAIFFGSSAGPNAASGVTACLLAFILPIASSAPASVIPDRLEGWWLASAVSTLAVLLLAPPSPGEKLRAGSARLAAALAGRLDGALRGVVVEADSDAIGDGKQSLLDMFVATPYRPIGLAAADQALASLIHLLEWCASLVTEATDGHLDLAAADPEDRALLSESAGALSDVAALMSGQAAAPDLERIWRSRLASASCLDALTADRATAALRADYAFHAQTLGVATSAAAAEALVASRHATSAEAAGLRRWLIARAAEANAGPPATSAGEAGPAAEPVSLESSRLSDRQLARWLSRMGLPEHAAAAIATDASLRSVWFRNSLRGAGALAVAVAVAKLTGVQHAFWVVLGTLSVLRTSAAATGSTALRALAGTIAGFVLGALLLLAIGTNPLALWAVFPVAVLIAAYAPGTAPFAAGQAAFTITVVVLFNLLVPAGWTVGLLRVEDVALGLAVSLIVGYLFWPRGISSVVGDNLADAFRSGARYLGEAVSWALGEQPHRPDRAVAAIAAGVRLDDALRGYLTEQGSKRMPKNDLWMLVMAAMRLRLTAHSMASLPTRAEPHADDDGQHAALERQLAGLTGFYQGLAAEVARPARRDVPVPEPVVPAVRKAAAGRAPCGARGEFRADALWVGHHLDHLELSSAGIVAPAAKLARLRRSPWWR
jgi:uncharacterized membrane protein YccC